MLVALDGGQTREPIVAPNPVQIRATLTKILSSRTFRRARKIRGLLAYVIENYLAGTGTSEAKTAQELLGREEFQPEIDPGVRVQFGRLRRLLDRYYQVEGAQDPIRCEVPKRRYSPEFRTKGEAERAGRHPEEARPAASTAMTETPTVAVLPFSNLTDDPKQDVFCYGLTEEIVTALAKIPAINVVASSSAFQYQNERVDVRAVGKELGAPLILEGSVRKEGTHTRVTAQLARAEDGLAFWSDTVDTTKKADLATQREVAKRFIANLPL